MQYVLQSSPPGRAGEWKPPPKRGTRWKHKSGVELLTQHRLEKINANARLFPNPALKKRARLGIIAFVVQLCCCAECCVHSYRAVGCCERLTACRNLCFRHYFTLCRPELQGLIYQILRNCGKGRETIRFRVPFCTKVFLVLFPSGESIRRRRSSAGSAVRR